MNDPCIYKVKAVGRLGNLLYSLCNAIKISISSGSNIEIEKNKKNRIFKTFSLNYSKSDNLSYSDFPAHNFFNKFKVLKTFGKEGVASLEEASLFLRSEVRPMLNLPTTSVDHDVVIHIRSGDLFDLEKFPLSLRPDWDHIQFPFSFYKKVILDHGFSRPLIVTESDFKNPVIELLKQEFPFISIQSSSIEEDFSTLVHAPNLILSNSSFAFMAALLSETISKVFMPDFCFGIPTASKFSFFDPIFPESFVFDFVLYDCGDYYKILEHYKKPEMLEVMKNFPISSINYVNYSANQHIDNVDLFSDFGSQLSKLNHFKL